MLADAHVPGTRRVAAGALPLLDVRENVGCMPSFDGLSLVDVLLPPDGGEATRGRVNSWFPRASEVPSFLLAATGAHKRGLSS